MSLNGNKYISGKTLIITDSNDGLPIFGLISNIYVIDSSLFCCEYQVFDTLKWDTDLQSYEIDVPNAAQATEFIDLEKLPDYTAYHPVPFNSKTYSMFYSFYSFYSYLLSFCPLYYLHVCIWVQICTVYSTCACKKMYLLYAMYINIFDCTLCNTGW